MEKKTKQAEQEAKLVSEAKLVHAAKLQRQAHQAKLSLSAEAEAKEEDEEEVAEQEEDDEVVLHHAAPPLLEEAFENEESSLQRNKAVQLARLRELIPVLPARLVLAAKEEGTESKTE